jgi:hypothetical protein
MNRLLCVFLFLVTVSAYSQKSRPIMFREEIFDFGSVKEDGGPVTHEFVFTNATNRPLRILAVQASCGCTTPGWSKDAVEPGKTGFIQASFNPKGRPGYFNKTLTVTSDVDTNPIVLQIKGNVSNEGVGSDADFLGINGDWRLKETLFNLGTVYHREEPTVRDFQFMNSGDKPVAVKNIVAPEHIKVDVSPKTVAPGQKGNIKVTYSGKIKNKYGFHSDNIQIETDDAASPVKSFTVNATLEDYFGDLKPEDLAKAPRLQLASTSLDFGRVASDGVLNREVAITNTGKKELLIKSVQGNCTCVAVSSAKTSLKPGESTMVKVTFNAKDRKASQNKAVTIYSNDPQNPVQRFTFTAYVE